MRTFLGLLVLIAGLGGLGYWAMTTHAARIEAEIMDTAAALDGPGLTIVVSGRDVTVAGVVQDAEALSTLRRQLEQIDGVREVRLVDVSLLPVASPFEIRLSLSDSGLLQAEGVLPSDEVRAAFDSVMGNPLDGLPLAAGAPDEAWGDVLIQTAEAVPLIEGGAAVLSDQTLTLSGQVRLPEDHAAVIDALGPLPEGYVLVDEIDVLDDGTPFRLTASVQDGAVTALGKVPATLNDAAILDFFDRGDAALDAARIAPPDGWQDVALAGAEALSALIEGELALEGQALTLTGSGSPD
ncbi:MAG: BON domain-containing protein, partial [Pseudomonadota bacterium]